MQPVTSSTHGTPAEAAPMSCAGTVLSQPPMRTTASIGCARIISSVSMDMRLRRYMLVGCEKLSWIEIVGNSTGSPPESITPRFTASTSCAAFPWDVQVAGMGGVAKSGDPLPPETIASIRKTRLALKGPLATPVGGGFRSSNVRLREEFHLYANLRPARTLIPGGRYEKIDLVL